jgi:hypothetical protein
VLYSTVLYCTVLHCTVLYKTANISAVAELHDTKECSVSQVLDCLRYKIK